MDRVAILFLSLVFCPFKISSIDIRILFPEIDFFSRNSSNRVVPKKYSRSKRRRLNKKANQRCQRTDEDGKPSDAPLLSSDQVRASPPVLRLPSQPPLAPPVSDQNVSDNPSGEAVIPDSGKLKLSPLMELVSEKKRKPMPSVSYGYCLRPRK